MRLLDFPHWLLRGKRLNFMISALSLVIVVLVSGVLYITIYRPALLGMLYISVCSLLAMLVATMVTMYSIYRLNRKYEDRDWWRYMTQTRHQMHKVNSTAYAIHAEIYASRHEYVCAFAYQLFAIHERLRYNTRIRYSAEKINRVNSLRRLILRLETIAESLTWEEKPDAIKKYRQKIESCKTEIEKFKELVKHKETFNRAWLLFEERCLNR